MLISNQEQEAPSDASEVGKWFGYPNIFTFNLLALYIDVYESEGLYWTPEAIQIQIEEDIGKEIPAINFDKLMTGITLLTTDNFTFSVADFARICVTLSGHFVNSNTMILPDSDDIAWGITEAFLINQPDDLNKPVFSEEITEFMGQVLDSEGIINPPDVLRIATRNNRLVNRVQYDFSDDPEMFKSIYDVEKGKTTYINDLVKSNTIKLVEQLRILPLSVEAKKNAAKIVDAVTHKFN